MPRYTLPNLILPVSVWRYSNWAGTIPPVAPADVFIMGNLTPGSRVVGSLLNDAFLLCGWADDIRFTEDGTFAHYPSGTEDLCEIPTGSGWFYSVYSTERVATGFANQHQEAQVILESPVPVGAGGNSTGSGIMNCDPIVTGCDLGPANVCVAFTGLTIGDLTPCPVCAEMAAGITIPSTGGPPNCAWVWTSTDMCAGSPISVILLWCPDANMELLGTSGGVAGWGLIVSYEQTGVGAPANTITTYFRSGTWDCTTPITLTTYGSPGDYAGACSGFPGSITVTPC